MSVQSIDWLAIAAPLVLALAAVVVLLADAFAGSPDASGRPRRPLLPAALTVLAVAGAAVPTVLLWGEPVRGTFCTGDALEGPATPAPH